MMQMDFNYNGVNDTRLQLKISGAHPAVVLGNGNPKLLAQINNYAPMRCVYELLLLLPVLFPGSDPRLVARFGCSFLFPPPTIAGCPALAACIAAIAPASYPMLKCTLASWWKRLLPFSMYAGWTDTGMTLVNVNVLTSSSSPHFLTTQMCAFSSCSSLWPIRRWTRPTRTLASASSAGLLPPVIWPLLRSLWPHLPYVCSPELAEH